ncbi:MAG: tyrosine-type recombinase/integrase, partial [Anaerolineae bacterium]
MRKRKRAKRDVWIVDYRDSAGIRRWATCPSRREAETILAEKIQESRQSTRPAVNPDITLGAYAERWLTLIAVSVKRLTLKKYEQVVRLHLLPCLGSLKVRQLHKGQLKALLAEKLAAGLARNSVQLIHSALRVMLNAAMDDGVILANPADKLGRQLRLSWPVVARQEELKAFTREQLARFLVVAAETHRRFYALLVLLARTGLRLGEALALRWEDVDFSAREIRVVRTLSTRGQIDIPKSGHGRTVDMSQHLARTLHRLQLERKTETLRRGWPEMPPWVFCSEAGGPLIAWKVEKAFKQVLKAAGLPLHFTPHGLRHTYASLLLQQGESPVYVQRQLGHASIKLTVDLYGRWLPMGNKAAVDRLDEAGGSQMVAKPGLDISELPESPKLIPGAGSGGGRSRRSSAPASGSL